MRLKEKDALTIFEEGNEYGNSPSESKIQRHFLQLIVFMCTTPVEIAAVLLIATINVNQIKFQALKKQWLVHFAPAKKKLNKRTYALLINTLVKVPINKFNQVNQWTPAATGK